MGHHAVLRLLIRKGTDFSVKDKAGQTAVWIAAEQGHIDTIRALYETRNVAPAEHKLAIQKARLWSRSEVVQFLEQEGARSVFPQPLAHPVASPSQIFYTIIIRQISKPVALSIYFNQIIEAAKSISESPHDLTQERRGATIRCPQPPLHSNLTSTPTHDKRVFVDAICQSAVSCSRAGRAAEVKVIGMVLPWLQSAKAAAAKRVAMVEAFLAAHPYFAQVTSRKPASNPTKSFEDVTPFSSEP